MKRREILKKSLFTLAGVTVASTLGRQAVAATCGVTPSQTEGPFYPITRQLDESADLTLIEGSQSRAEGDVIYIFGQVQDKDCKPVAGALVEIWQANKHGRYNHPSDPNTNVPLDKNFQYWGQALTDKKGNYSFKTIIPGSYPAAPGWERPPHIHFKVVKLGFLELTSQLYFEGHKLNDSDLILRQIPKSERERVIVKLEPSASHLESGSQMGRFDITLARP